MAALGPSNADRILRAYIGLGPWAGRPTGRKHRWRQRLRDHPLCVAARPVKCGRRSRHAAVWTAVRCHRGNIRSSSPLPPIDPASVTLYSLCESAPRAYLELAPCLISVSARSSSKRSRPSPQAIKSDLWGRTARSPNAPFGIFPSAQSFVRQHDLFRVHVVRARTPRLGSSFK